ncbi:hypothetical protein BRADI_1g28743v3, partial [Brachypodium distachyon]
GRGGNGTGEVGGGRSTSDPAGKLRQSLNPIPVDSEEEGERVPVRGLPRNLVHREPLLSTCTTLTTLMPSVGFAGAHPPLLSPRTSSPPSGESFLEGMLRDG